MKKKTGKILLITLLVLGAGGFATWYLLTADQRERANAVSQMPEFTGFLADGTEIRNKDLERDRGVIMFISTSCPYCRNEVRELTENPGLLRDHPIYLVASTEDIYTDFAIEFGLESSENIRLLKAPPETFRNFRITSVPQTMIYDKKGRLIERLEGYYPVEEIADYL